MTTKDMMIIADYSQGSEISLHELCDSCRITIDLVNEMIRYEILHPINEQPELIFDVSELKKLQIALRLQRDLALNLDGIAIVLDLLEERKKLLEQINLFEKHILGK